jgi:hypothetical protein
VSLTSSFQPKAVRTEQQSVPAQSSQLAHLRAPTAGRFENFEIWSKIVIPEACICFDTPKITLHLAHFSFITVQRVRTGLTMRGQPGGHRIAKA